MDAASIAQIANLFIQTIFVVIIGLGYWFTIRTLRGQVQEAFQARTTDRMEVDVAKLRELRRRRVLTLEELAEKAGVGRNTIWRLEHGVRRGHVARGGAYRLELPALHLFTSFQ